MTIFISGVTMTNTAGVSSLSLEDLSDVSIASPQNGDYLIYNSTLAEWQNQAIFTDLYGTITLGTTSIALGATATTISGLSSVGTSVVSMTDGDLTTVTYTSADITPYQIIDSVDITAIRTVKYLIQVTSGAAYQACEILILHDGTSAWVSQFADVNTGAILATFDASIVSNNLNLIFSPVSSVTTISAVRTTIDI